MGIIKRFFIKKALAKANSKNDMEQIADDVLKDATRELMQTGKLADKILKAKLMRQESQHVLNKIQSLDEELIDDDDEEQPAEDMQEKLTNVLLQKFLVGGSNTQTPQNPASIVGYDEKGQPIHEPAAPTQPTEISAAPNLASIANKLSPSDLKMLKDKFLK